MRRKLHVPQIAAVMGPCIAGGAYLPALSDVIIMVDNISFMGLGGPNLVKGAMGQVTDAETWAARACTPASAVWPTTGRNDDSDCIDFIRAAVSQLPQPTARHEAMPPATPAEGLYDLLPADHRLPYAWKSPRRASSTETSCSSSSPTTRLNPLRQRPPARTSHRRHRQPPRLSEDARQAQNRRHCLH